MRIEIDTNVMLVSASRRSSSYWLFNAFLGKQFDLAFTTEILAEYAEQFGEHWDAAAADNIVSIVVNARNTIRTIVYYRFNLITYDADDNKFADCAFASNADYLVSDDGHFDILKNVDFPKIKIVSLDEFKQILLDNNLIEP